MRHPHRLTPLCAALVGVLASNANAADSQSKGGAELDTVSVTATRTETALNKTPASISVITAQDIDEQMPRDLKDLLRFEPGVTVTTTPYRGTSAAQGGGKGSNSSVNIRGLDGNRVLLMKDGIRQPYGFSYGPQQSGRGDFTDPEELKRLEILRGPASTLYGSDGLTGALNFITKDPQDFLKDGRKQYFSLKETYRSVDQSWETSGTAAVGNETWQAMVVGTWRNGEETQNMGSNNSASTLRDTPNPQNNRSDSVLAKLRYTPDAVNAFKLSVESVNSHQDTRVLNAQGGAAPTSVKNLNDSNKGEQNRASFDYDYDNDASPWLQKLHALVYVQDSKTVQYSLENRNNNTSRWRQGTYEEKSVGGSLQADSAFTTGALRHGLIYGFDISQTKISGLSEGGGVSSSGFPNQYFPDTDYDQLGVYLQDAINVGSLTVTPGLRYDNYSLNAKASPLYKGVLVEQSKGELSPRLAVMYEFMPSLSAYAQYAHGFRAPTPDQVNNSFGNPAQGYTSIGNPNLKPETSDTVELGLKGKLLADHSLINYAVAAYQGRYKDFINQVIVSGNMTPSNPSVFQYINNARADIHGLEGRVDWRFDNGLSFRAAAAYAHGTVQDEKGQDVPLNSVNPITASIGARYDSDERWFTEAFATYRLAKKGGDVDLSSDYSGKAAFLPGSSVVFDLIGGVKLNKYVSINAGIYNLTDRKYWEWSNVRGVLDSSPVKNLYTAPGRNITVSLKLEY
ncbi:TonB-dependent hemoglobin/transferrin/lactoferrin family receptor [Neisseriaceae bacterium JH1-16]|nr:TonB-dependent hemoglobin/transferrin/lactoferrin family receptor [Neisseriaceae bacterium JH1-16]